MTQVAPSPTFAAQAAKAPTPVTLQRLIWPEQGICTERDLYVRLNNDAGLSAREGKIHFAPGGLAEFNTWFNLFNIGKWASETALSDLSLVLSGTGLIEITVFMALPEQSWERLVNEVIELHPDQPAEIDLSHLFDLDQDKAVLFFEIKALSTGLLSDVAWQTRTPPERTPDLMLAVTTFKREAAVERTAERFAKFIATSPLRDHIRLTVVDNGQSAQIEAGPHVRAIPNANLGGAGGFSRGLIEARATGATHCLFMDDDAAIHMESLERTWMFLAYATDPATAIVGSMINATHRWAIWENGAIFNTRCMPQHMGTDLRDPMQAFGMEFASTGPAPENFYGGWWYFAFPVEKVQHMPFPFFVRGDDVSFSLAHDFNMVTLPGVVSFQDSFTDKESPLTWYLDLRSHLAHHLSLPHMDIGALRTLKIAVWFFMRNVLRFHYDTLSAVNLALEDVLEGPEFFAQNADMAQRRADLKALTRAEQWQPLDPDRARDQHRFNPHNRWTRALFKLTLNGHLLPGHTYIGNRITLDAPERGNIRVVWGAAQITYLDAKKKNAYTVTQSKGAALREGWRMARNGVRFLRTYRALRKSWQEGYETLATDAFWTRALSLETEAGGAQQTEKAVS